MPTLFSTFDDVWHYLDEMPKFSQKGGAAVHYSLDSVKAFCAAMDDPQKKLRAVHVAGTNGKGTTCQMLASVYQQAGFKAGLYTSPHLNRFNERIRINASMIPDEAILQFFQQFETTLRQIPLTYFELSTCLGFWYLEKEKVDIALIETGMGGRLDATNVLDPAACVITSVGLDHTDFLGETLREIAREKGGIIKPDRPVIIGCLPPEAEEVIVEMAEKNHSRLIRTCRHSVLPANSIFELKEGDKTVTIPLGKRKKIDAVNIAVCRAVTDQLQEELRVNSADFCTGIEKVDERFREHAHFQQLDDSLEWYFDGAHNAEAIKSLLDHLNGFSADRPPILFLSMMKDKAKPEVLRQLSDFSTVYYIDMNLPRSAPCSQIRAEIPSVRCFSSEEKEVLTVLDQLKTELVIFTGSFYFYSEIKKWMASLTPSED
ncbi:MAG: folylpolyglutamate synthase/dihydrofolate synthase family protein [Balneolaceae bacterium]